MADFNSKYTGQQVEDLLDQVASGGGGGTDVYIADFTMESLRAGMDNGAQVGCDMQALVAAMNANKIILVREGENPDYKGVYVLNGYVEDLLYFSIVDTFGNILWCEGTDYILFSEYIDGRTLLLRSWNDKQDIIEDLDDIRAGAIPPYYIDNVSIEDLRQEFELGNIQMEISESTYNGIYEAYNANRPIYIRNWNNIEGYTLVQVTIEDLLYYQVLDYDANLISGEISSEYISVYIRKFVDSAELADVATTGSFADLVDAPIYTTEFSVEDIEDVITGETINISVKIVEAVLAQKIIRIPIREGSSPMVVALSTVGYLTPPYAGLVLEFIYNGKRYHIDIDDSMNDDYTLTLYRGNISVTTLVDDTQVTTIVNDAIADAITTTLNTPV